MSDISTPSPVLETSLDESEVKTEVDKPLAPPKRLLINMPVPAQDLELNTPTTPVVPPPPKPASPQGASSASTAATAATAATVPPDYSLLLQTITAASSASNLLFENALKTISESRTMQQSGAVRPTAPQPQSLSKDGKHYECWVNQIF